jgi:hypothetical protein
MGIESAIAKVIISVTEKTNLVMFFASILIASVIFFITLHLYPNGCFEEYRWIVFGFSFSVAFLAINGIIFVHRCCKVKKENESIIYNLNHLSESAKEHLKKFVKQKRDVVELKFDDVDVQDLLDKKIILKVKEESLNPCDDTVMVKLNSIVKPLVTEEFFTDNK